MKRYTCLIIALFFTATGHGSEIKPTPMQAAKMSPLTVARIDIVWLQVPSSRSSYDNMVRNIIMLKKGEPFSQKKLEQSLSLLKQTKKFNQIEVRTQSTDNLMDITFALSPFNFIKDIVLSGYYPLFEKDILNAMSIYVGDVFVSEKIEEQIQLIEEVFQQEGFADPRISIKQQQDSRDGNYTIYIDIEKGPYISLATVSLKGNRHFSALRLKSKMSIYRNHLMPYMFGRFIEEKIKGDIQRLINFYVSKGFFDCKIRHDLTIHDHTAVLTLSIDEGACYKINFIGNQAFWEITLNKDIALFIKGNANNQGVRTSIRNIRKRYLEAGYLNVGIKTEVRQADASSATKVIDFIISEGPRTQIIAITVAGNQHLTDKAIYGQMKLKPKSIFNKGLFNPGVLEEDLYAIQSLYLKEGYQKAVIQPDLIYSPNKATVSIQLNITENHPTLVSTLAFPGLTILSESQALALVSLKQGQPYRQYMLKNDEISLAEAIAEMGYIHVKVEARAVLEKDDTRANVVYQVQEGPLVVLGDVYYFGNFRTEESVLDQEIELEKDRPVSLIKMLKSENNIRNMDIFNSVRYRSIGLLEKSERINLFVEVEEKKPYYFEWGGGFESSFGFNTHFKIGDQNFWGRNIDASFNAEISEIGYLLDATLKNPRIWGTRISSTTRVYTEEQEDFNQDFGVRRRGLSQGFNRLLIEHVSAGLVMNLEQKTQYPVAPDFTEAEPAGEAPETFQNRTIITTTPSIQFDSRDNRIRPTRGFLSLAAIDISNSRHVPMDDFLKFHYDLRWYVTPVQRITLASMGRAGYIQPLHADGTVPKDQLFYLGGIADVRGFKENLLYYNQDLDANGGHKFLVGSLEARIDLKYNFALTLFYDIGKLYETYEDSVFKETRSSVGLGIHYITPVGPIGCLYGFKLNPTPDESPGAFHFSFGYTF